MIDTERQDFESWLVGYWPQSKGNMHFNDGHYDNHFMDYLWTGWLARSEKVTEPPIAD